MLAEHPRDVGLVRFNLAVERAQLGRQPVPIMPSAIPRHRFTEGSGRVV
jgi:hypothetical protein